MSDLNVKVVVCWDLYSYYRDWRELKLDEKMNSKMRNDIWDEK